MNDCIWNLIIKQANKSLKHKDVPVGAIIVKNNKIIAKGCNTREKNNDILGHAEINAIKSARKKLKNWNLNDCVMYVSLKPCEMCEEIIKQSRISKVIYLLDKPISKKSYKKTSILKFDNENLEKSYNDILSDFFKDLREKKG